MIEYIRRYLFARNICKKKGITFYPWYDSALSRKIKSATYKMAWDAETGEIVYSKIYVSLLKEDFYVAFAHELGHHLDNSLCYKPLQGHSKGVKYYKYSNNNPLREYGFLNKHGIEILQEMRASKTARRLLKTWGMCSTTNLRRLSWCFGTYVSNLSVDQKADVMYIGQRYIGSDY